MAGAESWLRACESLHPQGSSVQAIVATIWECSVGLRRTVSNRVRFLLLGQGLYGLDFLLGLREGTHSFKKYVIFINPQLCYQLLQMWQEDKREVGLETVSGHHKNQSQTLFRDQEVEEFYVLSLSYHVCLKQLHSRVYGAGGAGGSGLWIQLES